MMRATGSVTSALLSATVAWNMGGFATGFFQKAWGEAPIPVLPISYALNAAIAVALPFIRDGRRDTALASSVLGGLMAMWSAAGVVTTPGRTRLGPLPGFLGAGVPMVLGALASVSGFLSYRSHLPER